MRAFLVRRWFLLALVAGVAAAVLRPQWLAWTGWLDPRLVIAPALFLMAWGLPARSLGQALARPWPALWAVAISYGLLPSVALLTGPLLAADDLRIGLFISCSVPSTLASSVLWTRMGGGDEATALLVIVLTTATSWLVTTAWLTVGTGTAVALDTAAMMTDLLLTLLLPVGLGQLCRASGRLALLANRRRSALGTIAQLLILSILLKAAGQVGLRLQAGTAAVHAGPLLASAGLCVAVHLLGLGCGLWGSKLLGFDRPSQVAVTFACSQKTLPVALLLFERYFQSAYPLAVVPLASYHFGQLIVDTFVADSLARRRPSQDRQPPLARDSARIS